MPIPLLCPIRGGERSVLGMLKHLRHMIGSYSTYVLGCLLVKLSFSSKYVRCYSQHYGIRLPFGLPRGSGNQFCRIPKLFMKFYFCLWYTIYHYHSFLASIDPFIHPSSSHVACIHLRPPIHVLTGFWLVQLERDLHLGCAINVGVRMPYLT